MCLKLDVKLHLVARKRLSTGQRHMFIDHVRFLRRQERWGSGPRVDGWLRAEGRMDAVDSKGFVFGIRKTRGSHSMAGEAEGDFPGERRL